MSHNRKASGARSYLSRSSNRVGALMRVDGRSAAGRRYRDIVAALVSELGGEMEETEHLQIRNAAILQLHAEELAARLARGEPTDPEEVTKASLGAYKAMAGLRRRREPAKASDRPVRSYLARKGAAA